MNALVRIIIVSVVAFALSYILGGVTMDSFWTAILLALTLAVLNAIVKPILILLTLPITLLTFGLFLFVINALIILLADKILDGFQVKNFWWAMLFGLLLSVVTSILYQPKDRNA
ncbi:MAG TPA: phage holin family protein [Flavitalea sp.]|nr:phage holin family protein [Flavitalea sp.]